MGDKDVGLWPWNHLKEGKQNVVANALSRKDEDVEAFICAISIIQPDWITEARMNGRMTKKCGHSFKSCGKILVHMMHLVGKWFLMVQRTLISL